jgi:hypothetical protein
VACNSGRCEKASPFDRKGLVRHNPSFVCAAIAAGRLFRLTSGADMIEPRRSGALAALAVYCAVPLTLASHSRSGGTLSPETDRGINFGRAHGIPKLDSPLSDQPYDRLRRPAMRSVRSRGGRTPTIADADRSCGRSQRAACRTVQHRRLQIKTKHLLNGVAVIAKRPCDLMVEEKPSNACMYRFGRRKV